MARSVRVTCHASGADMGLLPFRRSQRQLSSQLLCAGGESAGIDPHVGGEHQDRRTSTGELGEQRWIVGTGDPGRRCPRRRQPAARASPPRGSRPSGASVSPPRASARSAQPTTSASTPSTAAIACASSTAAGDSTWTMQTGRGRNPVLRP